jgi:hypothetical protein
VAQILEHLSSKCEALGSIPSTEKTSLVYLFVAAAVVIVVIGMPTMNLVMDEGKILHVRP